MIVGFLTQDDSCKVNDEDEDDLIMQNHHAAVDCITNDENLWFYYMI